MKTRGRFGSVRAAVLVGIVVVFLSAGLNAQRVEKLSREDALAYFTLNCAYFGLWPAAVDPQQTKILRIGILGHNGLGEAFAVVAARARATWFRGGEIVFRQGDKPADLADCHIIFVADVGEDGLAAAIAYCSDRPILLLSESRGFVERGGAVGVHIEREALSFEVNLDRLHAQKINLDSKFCGRAAAFISEGRREVNRTRPGGAR